MSRAAKAALRLLVVLVLASLAPLRAQLDPRLAVTPTDFLDLFQQSTSTKIKPEIATIFDFSGSMRSLMFHPLYQNNDKLDSDYYIPMKFALGTANTYTITVKSAFDTSCVNTITVTLNQGFGTSSATSHTKSAGTGNVTTNLSAIAYSPTSAPTTGSVVTFSCTATEGSHSGSGYTWNSNLTWSCSGGTITSAGVWTAPSAYDTPVQVTLASGTMYGGGSSPSLSSYTLIKPDGSKVGYSDVSSPSGSFHGTSAGTGDVRNWIRAASHVRFQYTDGTTLRTVDVPIPWAALSSASSGSPLSTLKVHDGVSGNDMEIDSTYSISSGDTAFCTSYGSNTPYGSGSVGSSTVTTVYLALVSYRATYINWLFTGKYPTGSTYAGKYIVFDAANASLAGGQGNANWGQGFGGAAAGNALYKPTYDLSGNYLSGQDVQVDATANVVPARTRCQGVKEAAIRTWINYQTKVIWAFRFLDVDNESGPTTKINNSSSTSASPDPTASATNGTYSGWQVLNGNSVTGMQRLAAYIPYNGTPLAAAMARTLAQFSDPSSVFNAVENGTIAPTPPQCLTHYLILFTDGLDNNGNSSFPSGYSGANPSASPYISTSGSPAKVVFDAGTGNKAIMANSANLNGGSWWNLHNFAAVAAHLADNTLPLGSYMVPPASYPTSSQYPSSFLPFSIQKRNSVVFQRPHRLTVYTVGVSLGGRVNDTSSPKYSLFLAAVMGDPTVSYQPDVASLTAFAPADPNDPSKGKKSSSAYYFDGTDPAALVQSLDYAFANANANSNLNSTTNPNLPFVGGTLGQELYLGQFNPPTGGGVLWNGDLLMFSTRMLNGVPTIVDKSGNPLTILTSSNAQWSAATNLASQSWSARKCYTRIPGSSTKPEPGLTSFLDTGTAYTNISPYLLNGIGEPLLGPATNNDSYKKMAIQWIMGADTASAPDSDGRPTKNRATMMGDIINSTPAALEYNWDQVKNLLSGYKHLSAVQNPNRFRLIIVGDNQGWVHGFGEVSSVTTVKDSSGAPVLDPGGNPITIGTGDVDELWAFMPTDFLPYMDYLEINGNAHRFLSDGSPNIYFLDLPSTNYPNGNGVFDNDNYERAIAVFGLRKGGRSYYALNIANPFAPTLQWSLRPDEASLLASKTFTDPVDGSSSPAISSKIASKDNVVKIVSNMGFSTCVPAMGRVIFNDQIKDVVFLGGGYTVSQMDHNFPTYPNPPADQNTPLGRSILALDVWSGQILAAADMTQVNSTIGPIPSGLVPFEFFLNSGFAQRAYFMDLTGGLYCWDTNVLSTTPPYSQYRMDSSDLGTWSGDGTNRVRQVYQDATGVSSLYTAMPAPFIVTNFPGNPYTAGSATPAAVGIVMTSGDRNNPIDESVGYPNGTPARFRLTTVFDRQDLAAWSSNLTSKNGSYVITDTNLLGAGTSGTGLPTYTVGDPAITPGNASYYLAPTSGGSPSAGSTKFGYYINFPDPSTNTAPPPAKFIPKSLTDPYVVSSSAFYSYFLPTSADPCLGGSGYTYTNILCDVVNPALSVANATCTTGNALPFSYWSGVPSNFTLYGTRGVFQGGTIAITNPPQGTSATQVKFETLLANSNSAFPKVRVWRVVQ